MNNYSNNNYQPFQQFQQPQQFQESQQSQQQFQPLFNQQLPLNTTIKNHLTNDILEHLVNNNSQFVNSNIAAKFKEMLNSISKDITNEEITECCAYYIAEYCNSNSIKPNFQVGSASKLHINALINTIYKSNNPQYKNLDKDINNLIQQINGKIDSINNNQLVQVNQFNNPILATDPQLLLTQPNQQYIFCPQNENELSILINFINSGGTQIAQQINKQPGVIASQVGVDYNHEAILSNIKSDFAIIYNNGIASHKSGRVLLLKIGNTLLHFHNGSDTRFCQITKMQDNNNQFAQNNLLSNNNNQLINMDSQIIDNNPNFLSCQKTYSQMLTSALIKVIVQRIIPDTNQDIKDKIDEALYDGDICMTVRLNRKKDQQESNILQQLDNMLEPSYNGNILLEGIFAFLINPDQLLLNNN